MSTMTDGYLEITYRNGRALAAYYHLSVVEGREVAATRKSPGGMVVDFDAEGGALGIEIVAPGAVTLEALNSLLQTLNREPLSADEFAPLRAA